VFVAPHAWPVLASADISVVGGAEVQQVLLARALVRRGCRVAFVVKAFGQARIEHVGGIKAVCCPFRYLGGPKRAYLPDTLALCAVLLAERPDFVFVKGPPAVLLSAGTGARVTGATLIKIVQGLDDCMIQPSRPGNLIYLAGTRLIDWTIFQTCEQKVLGERNLSLKGSVIRNIGHPMGAPLPWSKRDVDVLWVGGCERSKQPDLMLDLAERMAAVRFSMIVSPRRDLEFNTRIEQRARAIPNVRYLGFVKYIETLEWCRRARLLCGTSHQSMEGFPNVYIQAWQAGTPVVSLLVDPDNVIMRNGLGVVSGSLTRMALDVEKLLADSPRMESMSNACVRHAAAEHSVDLIADAYMTMLDELECRPSRRGHRPSPDASRRPTRGV